MSISNDLLISCPNCGSCPNPKAGFDKGMQRYFCRKCDIHYTVKTPKLLRRHYRYSVEERNFAIRLYIKGYYPESIIQQFKAKYDREVTRESIYNWIRQSGIKPKHRSPFSRKETIIKICPRCTFEGEVRKRGFTYSGNRKYECRQCGAQFIDGHVCGAQMYPESFKEMAVSLYTSEVSQTLNETAKILNDKYHFSPPINGDTVGRWVEARGLMKSIEDQSYNRWLKRREKYGFKGMSAEKIEKLSEWRRQLWANPDYKKKMRIAMRHPKSKLEIPEQREVSF